MIVEVRTYHIKDGHRDEFLEIFRSKSIPLHWAIGMPILGPLLTMEDPNAFIFLRRFPSLEERDRMKNQFYEGADWKNELEERLMPLLERYEVVLTEADEGFLHF